MAQRINYGTGWIEISSRMNDALSAYALQNDTTLGSALAAFAEGDADPEEYGLAEPEESDDE